MPELIICALTVAALLHLWFHTSFLAEYATLLRLDRWLGLPECAAAMQSDPGLTVVIFLCRRLILRGGLPAFLGRMLACPNCLGLWLSLLVCGLAGVWWLTLAVYAAALWLFRGVSHAG